MSAGTELDGPDPLIGEIVRLNDLDTGFSLRNPKEGRPYCIVGVGGVRVRVVPMSTSGGEGVEVPAEVVGHLEAGWFVPKPSTVRKSLVVGARNDGLLPDPYLSAVLDQDKPSAIRKYSDER